MIPMNETAKLGAMPCGPRSRTSCRAKSSFVSPADAASIAIAGVCDLMFARQAERNVRIISGDEE